MKAAPTDISLSINPCKHLHHAFPIILLQTHPSFHPFYLCHQNQVSIKVARLAFSKNTVDICSCIRMFKNATIVPPASTGNASKIEQDIERLLEQRSIVASFCRYFAAIHRRPISLFSLEYSSCTHSALILHSSCTRRALVARAYRIPVVLHRRAENDATRRDASFD